jgi:hypothetical protein
MNEYNAIQVLAQAKRVFDKHNLEYWLDAGTLLGAIRDGKFIPWDEDIDLGTWHENIQKLVSISNELKENGFIVFSDDNEFIIEKNNCKLDFLFYHLDKGEALYILSIRRNMTGGYLSSLHVRLSGNEDYCNNIDNMKTGMNLKRPLIKIINMLPHVVKRKLDRLCVFFYGKIGSTTITYKINADHFKNLSQIEFYGIVFNAPNKIEEYLVLRYGEKWAIPDRNWVYYKDVPALAIARKTKQ